MNIKVYQTSDVDWVAADSLESALQYCKENDLEVENPHALTDEQMLKLKHRGDDGTEYEKPITFREELDKNIAEGIEFPCHFATSEI